MNKFNELAKTIHQQNVDAGWWPDTGRNTFECLQLVSTELAEATEGERKHLMDDHLPHRKMGEVELADALIRTLDLAGRYGWSHHGHDGVNVHLRQFKNVAAMHFICNKALIDLGVTILVDLPIYDRSSQYTVLVNTILKVGELLGYDVMGALHEKLEYNKHRADHKPEARAAEHGKKF